MPFNSRSYHRNKAKREASKYLTQAREAKAEGRGADDVRFYVRMARSQWSIYLSNLRMDRMDADMERYRSGKMTHEEFMAKWDTRRKQA